MEGQRCHPDTGAKFPLYSSPGERHLLGEWGSRFVLLKEKKGYFCVPNLVERKIYLEKISPHI